MNAMAHYGLLHNIVRRHGLKKFQQLHISRPMVSAATVGSSSSSSWALRSLLNHPLGVGDSGNFSSSSSTKDNNSSNTSGRSAFAQIPVHPGLLAYIQKVGVGIPKRNPKRRRLKKKKRQLLPNYIEEEDGDYHHHGNRSTLSRAEERELLGGSSGYDKQRRQGTMRQRSPLSHTTTPSSKPQPPPPFGSGGISSETSSSSSSYPPLIKVLGSVSIVHNNNAASLADDFPRPSINIAEVALVGRSNVGKSTLLNALLYSGGGHEIKQKQQQAEEDDTPKRKHKKLVTSQTAKLPKGIKAITSSKPGETRAITFYQLSSPKPKGSSGRDDSSTESNTPRRQQSSKTSLILVDLPGYGFAYGPSAMKDDKDDNATNVHPWQTLIETYLLERPRSSLKRILMLVDARHGFKRADFDFLESLQVGLKASRRRTAQRDSSSDASQQSSPKQRHRELPPIQLVLTKCDLVSQADLARRIVQTRQQLSSSLQRQSGALPEMLVSAQMQGQAGVLELQRELAALCGGSSEKESS